MAKRFNPNNSRDLARLTASANNSRKQLEPLRRTTLEFMTSMLGRHYGGSGLKKRTPINFIELFVNTYRRLLASNNPKTVAVAKSEELAQAAELLGLSLNHLVREIYFQDTLDEAVTNALMVMGIVKTGVEMVGEEKGQPFADTVSIDDWVHDTDARRYDKDSIQFAGNRYMMTMEAAMDLPGIVRGSKDNLQTIHNLTTSEDGLARIAALSLGTPGMVADDNKIHKMVELWDYWLPLDGLIVTVPADGITGTATDVALAINDWEGPEIGPYHLLRFGPVTDNIIPQSPVSTIFDLHDAANVIMRKLINQAKRQKNWTGVRGGADADGNRVMNVIDGEVIKQDDPSATQENRSGGIDQSNLAMLLQLREFFNFFSGNIETLGGLGPQAETLGQERLIAGSASQRIVDMENETRRFVKSILESLADYIWYDPLFDPPLIKPIPGTDLTIELRFPPELREGDLLDYNIDIVPGSLSYQSPAERMATIQNALNLIGPFGEMMQQQGVQPDFAELFKLIAQYTDTPELERLMKQGVAPIVDRQTVNPGGQAANTTRTNVRVNRPGATRQGRDAALTQFLLGGNVQESEAAGAFRPTG